MVDAGAIQRGGRALTTEQLVVPPAGFALGTLSVCEATAVWGSSPTKLPGSVHNRGQEEGFGGDESEHSGFIPALWGVLCLMSGRGQLVALQKQGWESRALQLPEGLIQIAGRSPNVRKDG